MEPLTGILTALAAKLANKALDRAIDELPGRLKRLIQGDPQRKAALRTACPPDRSSWAATKSRARRRP
ncbi:MAG TPA: hypothetical protein EYP49_07020, partial [Anaerolineae bacterium]|nr:hypothetical protein [Anaerolineae bacterium]